MSANLVIIQLLQSNTNRADFLRLCWENLTPAQKKEIFHFLFIGKQYKTFFTILRTELNQENPFVPWTHLFSIFQKIGRLSDEMVMLLKDVEPASEHGLFRIDHPLLSEQWTEAKKRFQKTHEERKAELLINLKYAKTQGLRKEREKALHQLRRLFPKDKDVEQAFLSEKEYMARDTLHRASYRKFAPSRTNPRPEVEPKLIQHMVKSALKTIKKNKKLTLDFAILFQNMELYTEALKMLDTYKRKTSRLLWHEVHICIEGQQFARALSALQLLSRRKDLDSEKSFSVLYFQALALHGLGKTPEALQIIKNIVKIRPHFKSASSLLLEWESDQ